MEYSEGYEKGSGIGSEVATKIGDVADEIGNIMNGIELPGGGDDSGYEIDYSKFADAGGAIPVEGSGKKSKKVDVDISDENLEYIRDIAEKDYTVVVKQDVLQPNVNVSFGDVHETADVKKLAKEIEKIMDEEISTFKEGD